MTLKLQQDDKTLEVWLLLSLRSLVRPAVQTHVKLDADDSKLEYRVSAAAELLANRQNFQLKDLHNPPAVGQAACEALGEIQAAAAKARLKRGRGR